MTLTRERIESLAPDQSSLSAALKLVKPASWPVLAANADASVLWGECQGSGSTPYRVVVSPDDVGYKCTCPSRKFPCKHVLAVLWLKVDKPERFATAGTPPWVDEWNARRRSGTGRPVGKPNADDGQPKQAPSLDAALETEPAESNAVEPKAAARAEAQRQRLRAEREAAVLAGLDDLDRWTLDQLAQGLAGFAARAQAATHTLSTRLVDAKASGLAARLDLMASDVFRVPEDQRADLAIERLAALTLIAAAYRHQHQLSTPLREDVRRAVGWRQSRDELLADATAPRHKSLWIVAANVSEVQPDKLRRLETWLLNATPTGSAPRVAVLIDFVPVSGGAFGFPFAPDDVIDGEVVFYPSTQPLRGLLASRTQPASLPPWPTAANPGIAMALSEFADRLAALPWLESWPLLMDGVFLRLVGKSDLVITDAEGATMPLERGQSDGLTPLLGLDGLRVLCAWDGRRARVIAADTPLGRWHQD